MYSQQHRHTLDIPATLSHRIDAWQWIWKPAPLEYHQYSPVMSVSDVKQTISIKKLSQLQIQRV